MKTFVAGVALMLSTAACSPWMEAWGPDFPQPKPGDAALYVLRDAAPEGAPPINLSIGRRPVGSLASQSWMRFDLEPRLYDLRAFGTQTSSEQIITVAPGQTRFMQVEATDTGGTKILEISSRDGRRIVHQGQHLGQTADPPRYASARE